MSAATVVNPPQRSSTPSTSANGAGSTSHPQNSPSGPARHRLLYRGALALPDSHLTLDGIMFSIPTVTTSLTPNRAGSSAALLDNPLALALEVMRGRPTLNFLGTVKLDDIYLHPDDCDDQAGVSMHVHPDATLSVIYFENVFCLEKVDADQGAKNLRTKYGVRVGLGGDEIPEFVIFGQPDESAIMHLRVARVLPQPPVQALSLGTSSAEKRMRLPRPDDPTPRKIPLTFFGEKVTGDGNARGTLKRRRADSNGGGPSKMSQKEKAEDTLRRAREVMTGVEFKRSSSSASLAGPSTTRAASARPPTAKTKGKSEKSSDALFRVPSVPLSRTKSAPSTTSVKGKGKALVAEPDEDVFGTVAAVASREDHEPSNKAFLKRLTVAALKGVLHVDSAAIAEGKDGPSNVKDHPEFKELFNHVYRGVSFAARNCMRVQLLEADEGRVNMVKRMIDLHVSMYIGGYGESTEEGVL
ncbi:hypothetical protein PUNSTDRAFT_136522 [Punctularia strigosozonata HHB-11173 SS5]|uniref:uncharacterized protein n=1 Tax=Punctularia strigosozonata (strain HHB-11173) TaxID=741275 RepID=UPI0004417168|nr:uncharacterized protein PUNSTDRAFT_136522 [Punctularia strigosozonata HHB-11173 SS5]EIN06677.1 hypothetical protein PUNSTDRAFT_136522 [Punctularia strigosozonata HHB-11173 SS5]